MNYHFENNNQILTIRPSNSIFDFKNIDEKKLITVLLLRVDLTNSCNFRCIFCHTEFPKDHAVLDVNFLRAILALDMPKLEVVAFGCGFEPLLVPDISPFLKIVKKSRPDVSVYIVSNGQLLQKHSFYSFLDIISYFHVSIHAHNESNFRLISQKGNFDTFCNSIENSRKKYPQTFFSALFVANKLNLHSFNDYIDWIFYKMKFNVLQVRKVFADPNAKYSDRDCERHPIEYTISDDEFSSLEAILSYRTDIEYVPIKPLTLKTSKIHLPVSGFNIILKNLNIEVDNQYSNFYINKYRGIAGPQGKESHEKACKHYLLYGIRENRQWRS